ncbi:MAG: hypothetical protein WBK77_02360 [Alphaproteobacteria bacterium]
MTKKVSPKKPRFINPPNVLKKKVGSGGIDEKLIVKSQDFVNNADIDFIPYAENFLKEFSQALREAEKGSDFKSSREKIITPIMQMKAGGGMFKYQLVSEVADTAMQFLDAVDVENVNNETFDILRAHENTLKVIVLNKLKGNGGREGFALIQELDKACKRYFTKYKIEKKK